MPGFPVDSMAYAMGYGLEWQGRQHTTRTIRGHPMQTTARIAQLRESIARRALAATGVTSAHIISVERIGTVFVVATETATDRWAPYAVETFRIPEPDDTDRDYEPGQAPKIWCPLAGWNGASPDEVPGMLAKAVAYAHAA